MKASHPRSSASWLAKAAIIVLSAGAIVAIYFSWYSPQASWLKRARQQGVPNIINQTLDSPMIMPGIREPTLLDVDNAEIADDTQVIGVRVGDENRAYCVSAMRGVGEQIVNDYFNQTAITVIYSPTKKYFRVVSDPAAEQALSIHTHALMNNELHVSYRGRQYAASDKAMPIKDWDFEQTDWKTWRTKFPATLVYTSAPDFEQISSDVESRRFRPGPPTSWPRHRGEAKLSSGNVAFQVRHPTGWELTGKKDGFRIVIPSTAKAATTFLDCTLSPMADNIVPQEFLAAAYDVRKQTKLQSEFELGSSKQLNVGDFPARRILTQYAIDGQPRNDLTYIVWTDKAGIRVHCHGPAAEVKRWLPVLDQISQSFRLVDN